MSRHNPKSTKKKNKASTQNTGQIQFIELLISFIASFGLFVSLFVFKLHKNVFVIKNGSVLQQNTASRVVLSIFCACVLTSIYMMLKKSWWSIVVTLTISAVLSFIGSTVFFNNKRANNPVRITVCAAILCLVYLMIRASTLLFLKNKKSYFTKFEFRLADVIIFTQDKRKRNKRRNSCDISIGISKSGWEFRTEKIVAAFLICVLAVMFFIKEDKSEMNHNEPKQEWIWDKMYVSAAEKEYSRSEITATIHTEDEKKPIKVFCQNEENEVYLFLPGFVRKVEFNVGNDLVFFYDNRYYHSGAVIENLNFNSQMTVVVLNYKQQIIDTFSLVIKKSENLQSFFIDTASGSEEYIYESKNNKEKASLAVFSDDGICNYTGKMSIKVRGNSTATLEKRPFNISLNKSVNLFGNNLKNKKAKNWCLFANAQDYSYLNNKLAYDMAEYSGIPYTSSLEYIDLYLNGEYWGIYLLAEKVEVEKNRVDITDLDKLNYQLNPNIEPNDAEHFDTGEKRGYLWDNNPSDITGGYLLECNYRTEPGYGSRRYPNAWFLTSAGSGIEITSPETASMEQVDYISSLIQDMELAFADKKGYSEETGRYYLDFIDLESWAKYYLVAEISYDLDKAGTNLNIYKDSDDKSPLLYAGPVWDYDCRFGGTESYSANDVLTKVGGRWWPNLYDKPEFYDAVCKYWKEDFKPYLEDQLRVRIDRWFEEIKCSVEMDMIRWDDICAKGYGAFICKDRDFEGRVVYLLDWVEGRTKFLSQCWE